LAWEWREKRLGDGVVTVNVNAGVAPGGGVVGNVACVLDKMRGFGVIWG
jgi:hypothetical protein